MATRLGLRWQSTTRVCKFNDSGEMGATGCLLFLSFSACDSWACKGMQVFSLFRA